MVPDYDQIAETESGQLEFFDYEGNSLGIFDSVKDFDEWRDQQNATESSAGGSEGEEATSEQSEGDASADHAESESAGSADFGGSSGGSFASDDEQAGDSEGVSQDEAPLSVEVANLPDDYATSASVEQVLDQLETVNTGLECLLTFQAVIVIALFACWASVGVQTLIRSFER